MSNWIWIAIAGYSFFAFNSITDKILLSTAVKRPYVYVFFNGFLASCVLVLIPFGVHWVSWPIFFLSLFGGSCFTAALYFYYTAVQRVSISRIQPIQGGLIPLFTLLLSVILLKEGLTNIEYLAFAFLTTGAVLISIKKTEGKLQLPALNYSIVAAFLFALHFVISKIVFDKVGFMTGLFWTRWGMFVFAIFMLISPGNRKEIRQTQNDSTRSNRTLFYFSRLCGAAAGILQNYAIALGNVAIVKALQSVQFTFVLIFASIFSLYYPKLIKETITRNILVQKVIAIALVVVGLTILTFSN